MPAFLVLALFVPLMPIASPAPGNPTDAAGQACPDAATCLALGRRYEAGEGVPRRPVLAAALYRRSCDGHSAAGCTSLGRLYAAGEGVSVDLARARVLFQEACDGGDGEGCARFVPALTSPDCDRPHRVEDLVPRGVVRTPTGYVALVLDEEDRPAFLTVGDRLFDGRVVGIDSGAEVRFDQHVADPLSPIRTREVRMPLYHKVAPKPAPPSPTAPGPLVSLRMQDAPLHAVLAALAEKAGLSLEASPGLEDNVALDVTDAPWGRVLHDLSEPRGLVYVSAGSGLRMGRGAADLLPASPDGKAFTGHPISLDFLGTPLEEILRLFADISGLDVIASTGNDIPVSVRLAEVPWDQAFAVLLDACGLIWRVEGNVVRIMPAARLAQIGAPTARTGVPVSLRLRDTRIADVVALLAHVTGLELVADPSLEAEVTADLHDVPWDLALELFADRYDLAVLADGAALRVLPAPSAAGARPAAALMEVLERLAQAPAEDASPEAADRLERLATMITDPRLRRRLAGRALAFREQALRPDDPDRRDALWTLSRILPDAPEADQGAAEVRALVAAPGARDSPLLADLQVEVGGAVRDESRAYVPLEIKGTGRLHDLGLLLERLDRTTRAMDVARIELSSAPEGRVRAAATLRMHFLSSATAHPELRTKVERVQQVRARSEAARRFLSALGTMSRDRIDLSAGVFEDDGTAPGGTLTGAVGWPNDVSRVEYVLTHEGFRVSKRETSHAGACQEFMLGVVASLEQIRAMGPARMPDEPSAPFEHEEDLCRVARDDTPLASVRATGQGALTLRLRDVDLADVFRLLYEQTRQGFVIDGDVLGRVSVDFRTVTLEQALLALRPAGILVSPPARLRRVSRTASGPPKPPARRDGGIPVSLALKRASIADFLGLFKEIAQRPVWAPAGLGGRISIYTDEAPWDEVRDAVLESAGLSMRDEPARFVIEGTPGPLRAVPSAARSRTPSPPGPEILKVQEFQLAGIVSMEGGWMACAYDPAGRLRTLRTGHHLFDARVREVGPGHVLIDNVETPPTQAKAAPPKNRHPALHAAGRPPARDHHLCRHHARHRSSPCQRRRRLRGRDQRAHARRCHRRQQRGAPAGGTTRARAGRTSRAAFRDRSHAPAGRTTVPGWSRSDFG